MFRSNSGLLVLPVAAALMVFPASSARAEDETPTPPQEGTARVVDLTPRVLEISSRESDLTGTATVARRPRKIDVTLNSNVLFGKDSAVILPAATKRLDEVGQDLKEQGPGTLTITGYTDDLGSAEHGLTLSKQRAEAVRKALAPHLSGITVTVAGKGEADPAVPNKDEKSRAQNRRVELHFTKK